jgi:hypothetical protein
LSPKWTYEVILATAIGSAAAAFQSLHPAAGPARDGAGQHAWLWLLVVYEHVDRELAVLWHQRHLRLEGDHLASAPNDAFMLPSWKPPSAPLVVTLARIVVCASRSCTKMSSPSILASRVRP